MPLPRTPGLLEILSESRVLGEYLRFTGDVITSKTALKVSDNWRPVLLIPGFLASDATLYPLGSRLRSVGHRVFYAGIWINADCPAKTLSRIERRVREISRQTARKVVLIGHSLGGVYAREVSRREPDLIERAFLLGSPIRHASHGMTPYLRPLAAAMRMMHARCVEGVGKPCPQCGFDLPSDPPPVPETIIYTRSDGVVPWENCVEQGSMVEQVEIDSSHCGIPLSLDAWNTISERLTARIPARPGLRASPQLKPNRFARVRQMYPRPQPRPRTRARAH